MTQALPPTNDPFPGVGGDVPAQDPADVSADQAQDQGSPIGRHLAQDPFDEPNNDADEFEFVRLPNGKVVAVPKDSIQEVPETATQTMPKSAMVEVVDPHFYVHLADGNVVRVKQSDLPAVSAGTNALNGHWQIDTKVYQIIGVYPVEDIVKGDQ